MTEKSRKGYEKLDKRLSRDRLITMDSFVCIHTCSREESLVIAGLLRASEVAVHLIDEVPANLRPFSDKKPMVRVMVPREAADFAYQIIQDAQDKGFADFEQSAELEEDL